MALTLKQKKILGLLVDNGKLRGDARIAASNNDQSAIEIINELVPLLRTEIEAAKEAIAEQISQLEDAQSKFLDMEAVLDMEV